MKSGIAMYEASSEIMCTRFLYFFRKSVFEKNHRILLIHLLTIFSHNHHPFNACGELWHKLLYALLELSRQLLSSIQNLFLHLLDG